MLGWIIGEFWPYILGAFGILTVFLGGRRSGKNSAKIKEQKEDLKTHERINDVDEITDADSATEFLHSRSK